MQQNNKMLTGLKRMNKGMLLISAILMLVGAVFLYRTIAFVNSAVKTTGVVTKIRTESGENGNTYIPTISFKDEHGKQHIAEPGFELARFNYRIGGPIPILYDPKNPTTFRIDSFTGTWLATVLINAATAISVFLLFGMWSAMRTLEEKQRLSQQSSE